MPRKHAFVITVLLGAVFVVGVVAVSRTVLLAQPAGASTTSDPAIAFRMRKLDRLEASLERNATALRSSVTANEIVIHRQAPSKAAGFADDDALEQEESPDD